MSIEITEAMVRAYHDTVTMQFQQKGSLLRGTVQERTLTGKVDFWDRVGQVAATKKTTRHSDSPQIDTPHSRRACYIEDYEIGDLVDPQDVIRILIDPKSSYASAQAMAMGRTFDDTIIAAMSAAVLTGEDGTTSVAFADDWPAARASASSKGGDEDISAAAVTTPNILLLKKELDRNNVPADGRHIVVMPSVISQLLSASSAPIAASSDYNTIKALMSGEINTWCGFTWHVNNRLPLAAVTDYYGFAYHESAIGVSIGADMWTRAVERPDKSFSYYIYSAMSLGAVRVQGEGVVRFRFDDSL